MVVFMTEGMILHHRNKIEERHMHKDILTVLENHEQLAVVEIADMMGAHPVTVDRHCYQLHQDGYIRVFNSGIYQLSDAGEAYLTQDHSESR